MENPIFTEFFKVIVSIVLQHKDSPCPRELSVWDLNRTQPLTKQTLNLSQKYNIGCQK